MFLLAQFLNGDSIAETTTIPVVNISTIRACSSFLYVGTYLYPLYSHIRDRSNNIVIQDDPFVPWSIS